MSAPDAEVVQAAVVAQGEFALAVDDVVADQAVRVEQRDVAGGGFGPGLGGRERGASLDCPVWFNTEPLRTMGEIELATMAWVDWYSNRRLHGSIGMIPPVEQEAAYHAALQPEKQPT